MNDCNHEQHSTIWPRWNDNKLFTLLLSVLALYAIAWLGSNVSYTMKNTSLLGHSSFNVFTVNGEGKVTAAPNIASTEVGVTTQNANAATAQDENNKKMTALTTAMKKLGILDADLKSSNYSVYPQYDYTNGRQQIKGYMVSQSLQVKVRDLTKVSDVLKVAAESGSNQVSGLSFTIDDPANLRIEARNKALQDAENNAMQIAERLGLKVGRVTSYYENAGSPNNPVPYYAKDEAMGMGGSVSAPTIQPGSNEVIMNVSVTYELL